MRRHVVCAVALLAAVPASAAGCGGSQPDPGVASHLAPSPPPLSITALELAAPAETSRALLKRGAVPLISGSGGGVSTLLEEGAAPLASLEQPLGEELPPTGGSGDSGFVASAQGQEYTWRDGERTRRVWVQLDLRSQPSVANSADDVVVRGGSEFSIVRRQPSDGKVIGLPVFRSESQQLVTLPGGVLVALDPGWDQIRIDQFFSVHNIASSRVSARGFARNAFFVRTAPGFAALELANLLAAQDGVVISSPNWQSDFSTQ